MSTTSFAFESQTNLILSGCIYNYDAGNYNSYSGSGTTWYNIHNTTYNGTLTNSPTYNSSNEKSFTFNGTNNYVDVGTDSAFAPQVCSWQVWFKLNNYPSAGSYYSLFRNRGYGYMSYLLLTSSALNHDARFYHNVSAQSTDVFGYPTFPLLVTGSIYHISVAFDGTNVRVLQNGQLYEKAATTSGIYYTGGSGFGVTTIARDGDNAAYYFDGVIYKFRFYNRGLSGDEMTKNWNAERYLFGL